MELHPLQMTSARAAPKTVRSPASRTMWLYCAASPPASGPGPVRRARPRAPAAAAPGGPSCAAPVPLRGRGAGRRVVHFHRFQRQAALHPDQAGGGSKQPDRASAVLDRATNKRGLGVSVDADRQAVVLQLARQRVPQAVQMVHGHRQGVPGGMGELVQVGVGVVAGKGATSLCLPCVGRIPGQLLLPLRAIRQFQELAQVPVLISVQEQARYPAATAAAAELAMTPGLACAGGRAADTAVGGDRTPILAPESRHEVRA
jgi:hypothetical protein